MSSSNILPVTRTTLKPAVRTSSIAAAAAPEKWPSLATVPSKSTAIVGLYWCRDGHHEPGLRTSPQGRRQAKPTWSSWPRGHPGNTRFLATLKPRFWPARLQAATVLPIDQRALARRLLLGRALPGLKLAGAIDTPAVLARRDDFVEHYQDGAEVTLLENYQATFVHGPGPLVAGQYCGDR